MRRDAGSYGEDESDDGLVRAARSGDDAAFARLMERHRPWVCRLIQAVLSAADRAQAEDLAQEAFLRVLRHLDDYTPRDQFIPWLKRIALNLARNALRDQTREREREGALAGQVRQEQSRKEPLTDPAAVLASRLLQQEVRAALERLPPEQRQALLLYYFAGQNIPEIARRTGCPEGTVKSRLFHARRQIRAALTIANETNDRS